MRIIILVFFSFLGQCILAQQYTALIVDEETGDPLIGANVLAIYTSDSLYTTTNDRGIFEIDKEDIQEIQISYLGYKTFVIKELTEEVYRLKIDEANIAANPVIIANPFVSNQVSFSRKEFQVLPGAYDDPSRLLLKAPGFTTANDQANSILYKGFPADFVGWTINDAYIVNPNHLSNAGSLSDVSSLNAGGVNMMSGQVIGTYEFNAAPNALPSFARLAGNSNMVPTAFNRNYLNLSLIGLEAGYGVGKDDGPNAHVNYRYSTVGLLTGPLGLDFGGEQIQYQDIFSRFTLIKKPGVDLKGFVGYGWSENDKREVTEPEEGELTFKDSQEILFGSRILLSGLKLNVQTAKGEWNASLNLSGKRDERSSSGELPVMNSQEFSSEHDMISGIVSYKVGNIEVGASGFYYRAQDELEWEIESLSRTKKFVDLKHLSLNSYVKWSKRWNQFAIATGLLVNYSQNQQITLPLNPHLELKWLPSNRITLKTAYRRNSQLMNNILQLSEFNEQAIGDHVNLGIEYKVEKSNLYGELFYHRISGLSAAEETTFSTFTGYENISPQLSLNRNGEAFSRGIGIGGNFSDLLISNLNLTLSGTFFDAQYSNGTEFFESPFSFRNSFNALITYKKESRKDREWVFSWSLHRRGGLSELPIDLEESQARLRVVYDHSNLTERILLQDYVRMDARVLYNMRKGSYRKFAKSLSLDIQNLSSRENDAFTNINFLTGETFVQKQLGLIPVLAYRIEF